MTIIRCAGIALVLACGVRPGRAPEGQAGTRPAEVTDSAVARGRKVFSGPANCTACHGADGRGTVRAPSLADTEWTGGRGTYEEILERVTHGVPRRESSTGEPMPMRGWSTVSDDEARAVAAYVWWLAWRAGR